MEKQKRIAAIHDISCFGKCSLTVALPIISAAGIEVSVIPAAVLSTHTGGFDNYTYRDLTSDMPLIVKHWQSLNLDFDAIYTGFLGSFLQLDIVSDIFDRLKTKDCLIMVDPVMADNGRLYKVFDKNFPQGMKKLCKKAGIIVPNITEALLLLDEPYREGPYTKEYIEDILIRLSKTGPEKVVLTGVYLDKNRLGTANFDSKKNEISYAFSGRIEGIYHGTGDVLASALLAALLKGLPLSAAARIAVDFTAESIVRTRAAGTDVRYGVNFEEGLAKFANKLNSKNQQKCMLP